MSRSTNPRTQIQELSKRYKTNSDIVGELINWYGFNETKKILSMTKNDLQNTVRVNFLKRNRLEVIKLLAKEGIVAEKIVDIPEGLVITKGWEKVGYSRSYLAGEIMPQGLGSMLAVHALDPRPGDNIIDLAAAPGGKSCFIGERMKQSGQLFVNDVSVKRSSALINNLSRHGIMNFQLINKDAMKISGLKFDKVMLDAPCSGDGLIVSQEKRRRTKSTMNSYAMQKIQISLLRHAHTLLNKNGICVYSTCALTPIENEMVILQVKNKFEIQSLSISGHEGFTELDTDFSKVKRLLPSTFACDGFFIAKLRRLDN